MTVPNPKIIVAQRYDLQEVVGQGGYGVVYRALDLQTSQTVAVKVLSPGTFHDPHILERMVREQEAMLALAGTGAVTALDLCQLPSGGLCLVMEWLEGIDLERHLSDLERQGRRLSVDRLMRIVVSVVETLQRAHQLGIVHRDIKPANLFLLSSPRSGVRLLDFGLSRMRSSAPLTAAGIVMGSPSYIAPEVWRGNSSLVDHRADLYSLAVIVFRTLTGQVPFPTDSLVEKRELVLSAQRPSLCTLRPDLPPSIDEWIEQALAIDPARRFNTARALLTALVLSLGDDERDFYDALDPLPNSASMPPLSAEEGSDSPAERAGKWHGFETQPAEKKESPGAELADALLAEKPASRSGPPSSTQGPESIEFIDAEEVPPTPQRPTSRPTVPVRPDSTRDTLARPEWPKSMTRSVAHEGNAKAKLRTDTSEETLPEARTLAPPPDETEPAPPDPEAAPITMRAPPHLPAAAREKKTRTQRKRPRRRERTSRTTRRGGPEDR